AGDIQVFSNIESERSLDVIYEAWWQQLFFDDRLRVKVGKIDANTEFAFVDIAGGFANSSAGFQPTMLGFPTYPDTAFGVNAFYTFGDREGTNLTLGYGFYDGALGADGVPTGRLGPASFFSDDRSDDYAHHAQADLAWNPSGEGAWWRDGRASVGVLHHTGTFGRFGGGDEDGSTSLFATVEQRLFDSKRSEASGVYVFGQYGWADEDISDFAQHFGVGVVLRSTFPGRDDDEAGVYFTYADLSDAVGAGFDDDESVVEGYYTLSLTPAVFVQPSVQFIMNPSGDDAIDDALVIGLRVGVEF
ncbi:MAG: carbohydrate porin, partial [Planctomycetota bacterium]